MRPLFSASVWVIHPKVPLSTHSHVPGPRGIGILVMGGRQSWLTEGLGWDKAWRGSIWHWLPSDKITPFISAAIVKLMSYVCNRTQWLEQKERGQRVLDAWSYCLDSQGQLGRKVNVSTRMGDLLKGPALCYSWQWWQVVDWYETGGNEPYPYVTWPCWLAM